MVVLYFFYSFGCCTFCRIMNNSIDKIVLRNVEIKRWLFVANN